MEIKENKAMTEAGRWGIRTEKDEDNFVSTVLLGQDTAVLDGFLSALGNENLRRDSRGEYESLPMKDGEWLNDELTRYATKEEAIEGHKAMVLRIFPDLAD